MIRRALGLIVLVLGTASVNAETPVPIKVGAALALTGGVGGTWGTPELQGVQLAVDDVRAGRGTKKREIELIVEDTKSDNAGTVKAVNKLIALDKVQLLVGPTWLDSYQGAIPLIEAARLPALTPSAGSKTMNPRGDLKGIFSMFPSEERQFQYLLDLPRSLDLTKVAYVYDEDPYWTTFRDLLDRSPPAGVSTVAREVFPIGITDFRSWLTRIRKTAPQAFVGGFATQESALAFLKQSRALGLTIPFISVDTLCEFRLDEAFKGTLDGAICVYVDGTFDSDFVRRFRERYGQHPTPIAVRGYDAVMTLMQALEKAGSVDGVPKALREGEFISVSYGKFRFEKLHGVEAGTFIAKRVAGEELEAVSQ